MLFLIQITQALKHATGVIPGFIHRDLKPENILIGADKWPGTNINRLRVTDLGLVKVLATTENEVETSRIDISVDLGKMQTKTGIVGTPHYMAPEQWDGKNISICSDIYAVGCILYEMLTGFRPIDGGDYASLESAHKRGNIRPFPESLPKKLVDAMKHCLALESNQRFATWEDADSTFRGIYQHLLGKEVPISLTSELQNLGHETVNIWSYLAIANSYSDIGNMKIAQRYIDHSYTLARKTGDSSLECMSLLNSGIVHIALGNISGAIDLYTRSLKISQDIGDRRAEGMILGELGIAYGELGDFKKAIEFFESDLKIALDENDTMGAGMTLGNLGLAHLGVNEYNKSISLFEQQLALARENNNRFEIGRALGNLGHAYFSKGDGNIAVEILNQRLAIARQLGDRVGEGNALGNLGLAYEQCGMNKQALDCLLQSLEIRKEIGDSVGIGNDWFNIARLFVQQEMFQEGLVMAEQAEQSFKQTGNIQDFQDARQLVRFIKSMIGRS